MNAQQAWGAVLQQLQLDMSKASFDRWVHGTEAVTLQSDVLIVGARDAETCDWLESRLTSTVQRLLTGILNQTVAVRFVAAESQGIDQEPEEEDTDPELTIEPAQWLDYESIVRPHRQVVVKGYLRRLGKEIGAKVLWLYIGFHQAAWMVHDAGSHPGSILHSREIRRFSGLSVGAFWRALKQPEVRANLGGLVERVDPWSARAYRRGRDGRPHRVPVRYRVFMTPRLTRADAHALQACLKRSWEAGSNIEQGLRACLAEGDATALLQADGQAHTGISMPTVMDIARQVAGGPLSNEAEHLAQELHRRVVIMLGDIHITHYFITQVIHRTGLTPAQAWLVTVARDMAYINFRTGERREVVTFKGGYREMAELVGSRRPKTVQAWFRPDRANHRRGGDVCRFMQEIETPDAVGYTDVLAESMPRTYRVLLDEPVGANGGNRVDANGSNRLDADGGNMLGANGGVKNSFKHLKSTERENTSNTDKPRAEAAPTRWDLAELLARNRVHPTVQRALLEAQVSPQAFISWVLYAASRAGKWIADPLGYAVSRLRAEPGLGAGGAFDRLATLSPKDLLALVDLAAEDPLGIGPHAEHRYEKAWREAMGCNLHSLMTVRTILFGKGGLA